MFQSWLYLNYLSTQISNNTYNLEQAILENKFCPDNSNQTRSRRGSNQFQPIILSPTPQLQKCVNQQIEDDDYCPDETPGKKGRKSKQDQNRNVIPNTIHQIMSFIQKKIKSGKIVEKIFKKQAHQTKWNIKRFYIYQSKLKDKINHYVNEETLSILNQLLDPQCHVYSESEQRFYMKVTRILVHHFLNHDSAVIVLTSKRMNNNKKKDHLSVRRLIQHKVAQIYQQK